MLVTLQKLALACAVALPSQRLPVLPANMRTPTAPKMMCSNTAWLPKGADETTLKRRFRELSRQLHPDLNKDGHAQDQFVALTAEYRQRLDECHNEQQRKELEAAWLQLGGLGAAAALVFSTAPLIPAAVAATVGAANFAGKLPSLGKVAEATAKAAAQAEEAEQAAEMTVAEATSALDRAASEAEAAAARCLAAQHASEAAAARWSSALVPAQQSTSAARMASFAHARARWWLRLRGVFFLRSKASVLRGLSSVGNTSIALLGLALPYRKQRRAAMRRLMGRLDQQLRDAHATQALALASLHAAADEARERNAEAMAAERVHAAALAATATASGKLAARAAEVERARLERIDRQRDVENWGKTTEDAKAVASSMGGLGRAIAGATGQAFLDLARFGSRAKQKSDASG